ncbi:MAG TPA: FkbM family methyltransferase [Gemmatimonadales bacterium]|nr:FkbM family methyltransferase [Gemmatimonadales bacterium]
MTGLDAPGIASPVIVRAWRKLWRHVGWLGWPQAVRYHVQALLRGGSLVPVTIGRVTLVVRAGTSDIEVAGSVFGDGEFEPITAPDCRLILDGGAHIGASALHFARRYPGATVVAVEPERENYELLRINTAGCPNVVPVRAALWSCEGTLDLWDRGTGPWGYTVIGAARGWELLGQAVPAVTIGALLRRAGWQSIDILKLDIEGAEKEVLLSAAEWIARVRVVIVELHEDIQPGATDALRGATAGFFRAERLGEKIAVFAEGSGGVAGSGAASTGRGA